MPVACCCPHARGQARACCCLPAAALVPGRSSIEDVPAATCLPHTRTLPAAACLPEDRRVPDAACCLLLPSCPFKVRTCLLLLPVPAGQTWWQLWDDRDSRPDGQGTDPLSGRSGWRGADRVEAHAPRSTDRPGRVEPHGADRVEAHARCATTRFRLVFPRHAPRGIDGAGDFLGRLMGRGPRRPCGSVWIRPSWCP